jgi:energy-coupling factor transport system substrate-specific component
MEQMRGQKSDRSLAAVSVDARVVAMAGIMIAFVFVMTYVPKINIGAAGYIHLGDAAIYAASFLFGPVVGLAAAAVGPTIADLAAGYGSFAPGTFIIHGLQGVVAAWIAWRRPLPRQVIAAIVGGAIVVIGYFLYQWLVLRQGVGASAEAVPLSIVQVVAGGILGIAVTQLVVRAYPPVLEFGKKVTWRETGE